MKTVLLFIITFYQKTISPDHGLISRFRIRPTCRFHPTCSEYAKQAIERFGVIKGCYIAFKRITRCHPWNSGGIDPVPHDRSED